MEKTVMPDRLAGWIGRTLILLLVSIPLWLIYSNPPLELSKAPPAPQKLSSALCQQNENASKLLLDEHQKVVDEIKMRIEEGNELFRYKFALMGGLILAFLGHIAFPLKKKDKSEKNTDGAEKLRDGEPESNTDGPEERIASLMNSTATFLVLALAFTIAVVIDLHMRTGTISVNQLALWIKGYLEPAFIQKPLVGYESYLRLPHAMESSNYYAFLYWPPEHLISWLIYMAYLIVLQNVCWQSTQRRAQVLLGFALVHISLAAFAWMGHTAPDGFQFRVFGLPVNGMKCPFYYLVPWLSIVCVNLYYVLPLFRSEWTRWINHMRELLLRRVDAAALGMDATDQYPSKSSRYIH